MSKEKEGAAARTQEFTARCACSCLDGVSSYVSTFGVRLVTNIDPVCFLAKLTSPDSNGSCKNGDIEGDITLDTCVTKSLTGVLVDVFVVSASGKMVQAVRVKGEMDDETDCVNEVSKYDVPCNRLPQAQVLPIELTAESQGKLWILELL